MKTKTIELALDKAATLPAEAQEQIGRDVLERVDRIARLRAELEIGIRQLDAGLGEPLDIEVRELNGSGGLITSHSIVFYDT
jgi:hypothetical protein